MYTKREKTVVYILVCLTILSLLTVMYLGRYNYPTGDDYVYGAETVHVWEETGSLIAVLAEAGRGTIDQYFNWQGTYAAIFLMFLTPNIFGLTAYRFVTPVMILLLVGSIFYLLKQIICGLLKAPKELWLVAASLVTFISVHTVPFPGESFFWYVGAMYYTGFYALTLFLIGVMLRYLVRPRKYHVPILLAMAVVVGGGTFLAVLAAVLVFALLTIGLFLRKSKAYVVSGSVTIVLAVCLLFSITAPGNSVHSGEMWRISAPKAIIKSLLQGMRYLFAWIGPWWIISAIILTPFLWKAFKHIKFRFTYPVIFIGLAYGVFCSMSCPTFYTMNSTGPARAVDIVYYAFILFTFGSYGYLLGYLHRIVAEKGLMNKLIQWKLQFKCIAAIIILVLVGVQIISGSASMLTVGKAINLLVSGEVQAYHEEYQERLQVLEDPAITEVVFKPFKHQPDMVYVGDMGPNVEDLTNRKVARYFDKVSVRVEW